MRPALLLVLLVVPLLLAGCPTPPASQTTPSTTPAKAPAAAPQAAAPSSDEEYVWIGMLTDLPYFVDHKAGLELAGQELNVKTAFLGPPGDNSDAMVAAMEEALVRKPAGMLVVGFNAALDPVINKAVDQGVPVITLDADRPGTKRLCFIGTGNHAAGVAGAKVLAEAVGDRGDVIVLTKTGQSNLEERVQGYKDELARHPSIKVVQVGNTKSDPTEAATVTALALQKHPGLAGIGCVEAAGGTGAATAVREANRAGQVKIVSMDRDDGTLEQIEAGVIYASIAQKTALMPYLGVKLLYDRKHRPVPIVPDNLAAGIVPLPAVVDTGVIIVTKENAAQFYHQKPAGAPKAP